MSNRPIELDESKLDEPSLRFANRLFRRFPELRRHAGMLGGGAGAGFRLVVDVPSPTGDPGLAVGLWMEDGTEPSLGFGPGHTHASVERAETDCHDGAAAVLRLLERILTGVVVVSVDLGGRYDGHERWLSLDRPDAVLEYLTDRYAPNRIRLRSWSGHIDRIESIWDSRP